jgi:hypothetical protein
VKTGLSALPLNRGGIERVFAKLSKPKDGERGKYWRIFGAFRRIVEMNGQVSGIQSKPSAAELPSRCTAWQMRISAGRPASFPPGDQAGRSG